MTREINPFGLRMQPDLRSKVEAAATASGRSVNSEITYRLEQSFGAAAADDPVELMRRIEQSQRDIGELLGMLQKYDLEAVVKAQQSGLRIHRERSRKR